MEEEIPVGQLLARSVRRHLRRSLNFQSLEEFIPQRGLRVDVMAIGPKGEVWIVECKSSRADFVSDSKWHGYMEYCDQFFWAVDSTFPHELLPEGTGLILADKHDAEIVRFGEDSKIAPARRRKLLLKFARNAADRHFIMTEASAWERLKLGLRTLTA